MALDNILRPKSEEEVKDLEKRGFRKNAGKWRFNINISDLIKNYEEDEDTCPFRKGIIDNLNNKISDLGLFATDEQISKFKKIIKNFENLSDSPSADQLDSVMEKLYDWADDNDVWIESF